MYTRKKTKVTLLIDVLSDREWHWGDELSSKVGWRFGATVKGLSRTRGDKTILFPPMGRLQPPIK